MTRMAYSRVVLVLLMFTLVAAFAITQALAALPAKSLVASPPKANATPTPSPFVKAPLSAPSIVPPTSSPLTSPLASPTTPSIAPTTANLTPSSISSPRQSPSATPASVAVLNKVTVAGSVAVVFFAASLLL